MTRFFVEKIIQIFLVINIYNMETFYLYVGLGVNDTELPGKINETSKEEIKSDWTFLKFYRIDRRIGGLACIDSL